MLLSTASLYFLSSLALRSAFAVVFQGEVSTFNALRNADSGGNAVVATIYSTCVWYDVNGEVIGTGPFCVSTLINYMLQAMASAAESYAVADASSGPGMVQEHSKESINRRSSDKNDAYSGRPNVSLAQHAPDLRVTHFTRSEVHPLDGAAAHLNVFGHDSALIVHTNGSHAYAAFEDVPALQERAFLRTNHQYFTFGGVNGIKMQARGLNGSATPAYVSDLQAFASQFANVTDKSQRATFQENDSWDYEVCDISERPLFYGKIVAENNRPGSDYEDAKPIGCKTAV